MPRLNLLVQGVVQGVGFRPFVYRTALHHHLAGWVRNRPDGVEIEIQGSPAEVEAFRIVLETRAPSASRILSVKAMPVDECSNEVEFRILESLAGELPRPSVPADMAICPECAQEMDAPDERRYRYPFTNCTHCGPRYSIIAGLPYDRPRTSMRAFPLCADCLKEYQDPGDRRFHAQPVACPRCGPNISAVRKDGTVLAFGEEALQWAVAALKKGEVLALKGLGGFQLLVDACSAQAIARLRERKRREEKPFAVLFPDLDALRSACETGDDEVALLVAPEAPILLLRRSGSSCVHESVAPGNPRIGAFLPYTPLHRLLLAGMGAPLVCTSGNLSDEPMAIEEQDAFDRLGAIADFFLIHNRPILRPVDDSVLRMDEGGFTILRRARGFAPLAHSVPYDGPPILALGAHQKNTIALLDRGQAILSQHLGDLHTLQGVQLLERTVADLMDFFRIQPEIIACDLHPDYASTRLGERLSSEWKRPLIRVQHHHAHVAAVMAEHRLNGSVLGLAWDGTGLGTDGTLWGGEALVVDVRGFKRLGHLRAFSLPSGDKAAKEPRRSAAGLGWELRGRASCPSFKPWFSDAEYRTLCSMLERGLNSPRTSSIGRLFDAVSAMLGIRTQRGFEGQAAMELEFAAERCEDESAYPWAFSSKDGIADPTPLMQGLEADRNSHLPIPVMARRFHNSLADLALQWAHRSGCSTVALSGGCFQNATLTKLVRRRLEASGFQVFLPKQFPPNDGAIALGQAWVAAHNLNGIDGL